VTPWAANFIGLAVKPGFSMVDTGAQDGVCGRIAMEQIKDLLRRHGLQVVHRPAPPNRQCIGVGGGARVIAVVDVPVALAHYPGVVTMTVLDDQPGQEVPPLLPINLLEGLGSIIDVKRRRMELTSIGRVVPLERIATGHLITDMMDFGPEGWKLPVLLWKQYGGRDPFQLNSIGIKRGREDMSGAGPFSDGSSHHLAADPAKATKHKTGKDHWEEKEDRWIRHHLRPRTAKFTPIGSKGAPPVQAITGTRRTVAMTVGTDAPEVVDDTWTGPQAHEHFAGRWTGRTEFFKVQTSNGPDSGRAQEGSMYKERGFGGGSGSVESQGESEKTSPRFATRVPGVRSGIVGQSIKLC